MYVIANWKENKTVQEAREWLEEFSGTKLQIPNNVEVVICPSHAVLPMMVDEVSELEGIKLGAQNVSKFEEGQYTGEVSAKMLKDFVNYVIVGHSERRKHFGETDGDVAKKSVLALKYGLVPIVCVATVEEVRGWKLEAGKEVAFGESQNLAKRVSWKLDDVIFAYEPLFAVGTGTPDTPENAQEFAQKIKSIVGQDVKVLYGGSVDAKNARSFVSQPDISGVLVGQASLDAGEFAKIIKTLKH